MTLYNPVFDRERTLSISMPYHWPTKSIRTPKMLWHRKYCFVISHSTPPRTVIIPKQRMRTDCRQSDKMHSTPMIHLRSILSKHSTHPIPRSWQRQIDQRDWYYTGVASSNYHSIRLSQMRMMMTTTRPRSNPSIVYSISPVRWMWHC